jgi:hypothetical protein
MISGSMNKRTKEIVEQYHLQMYFKKKTQATSTCRLGESNKEHWGQMIDVKIHETSVEAWTNKHGNKTNPMEDNNTMAPLRTTTRKQRSKIRK